MIWPQAASHPLPGRSYLSCAYVPMIELLRYLEANGFTTYIASGGDRDFMRPFAEQLYGIPPERVIGSALRAGLQRGDTGTDLLYKSTIDFFDDGPEAGADMEQNRQASAVAGGNSNGDIPMLRFARHPGRDALRLLVLHDDPVRGVRRRRGRRGRPGARQEALADVVSIKADWATVFP